MLIKALVGDALFEVSEISFRSISQTFTHNKSDTTDSVHINPRSLLHRLALRTALSDSGDTNWRTH